MCRPSVPSPSIIACGLVIALVKLALKTLGFAPTLRWIELHTGSRPRNDTLPIESLRAIEHKVAIAGALFPGRALCLEQSLTLYHYLRRAGLDATFRVGIQAHPFAAHAWVEYRGIPVNDVAEHVNRFQRLTEPLV